MTKHKKDVGCSYNQFHKKAWDLFPNLRPFGTMAVVMTKEPIQSKLDQKGTPMIYVGPALNHAKDVYHFLNPTTQKFIESRDVVWMNQMYGDWKGLSPPEGEVFISRVPPEGMEEVEPDPAPSSGDLIPEAPPVPPEPPVGPPATARLPRAVQNLRTHYNPGVADVHAPRQTRSQLTGRDPPSRTGRDDPNPNDTMSQVPAEENQAGREESKAESEECKVETVAEETETANAIPWQTAEQASINWADYASFDHMACLTMLDSLQLSPHDLAMASMIDVDPTTLPPEHYKDQFANPMSYDEAWNHSCPFQREKWREAIHREFNKMNEQKVWKIQKKSGIPAGRRLVKWKWVFEIKRDGKFCARLVACGYSQIGGVDFHQVFSPVVNDVTFRIMLIAKRTG